MAVKSWKSLLPELGQRTQIVGVLNLTPDSFSDGGRYSGIQAAVEAGLELSAQGADMLDLGGETTRPGSEPVSVEEELGRVMPVLERLVALGLGPISIDTTKAAVARRALAAGAHAINDVSAMTFDAEMASVAASFSAPVILMHMRAPPKVMQEGEWSYPNGVVRAVSVALSLAVDRALEAGLDRGQIVLDPGIGFGKTVEENLSLMRGLATLAELGFPLLVGPSRKSFLGTLTGRAVDDRIFATAASVAAAALFGASMVRVHDVRAMVDVVKVADALRTRL